LAFLPLNTRRAAIAIAATTTATIAATAFTTTVALVTTIASVVSFTITGANFFHLIFQRHEAGEIFLFAFCGLIWHEAI